MKTTASDKAEKKATEWPKKAKFNRTTISVYKRSTPSGTDNFMVSDYEGGKRKFISYPDEARAMDAALKLAERLDKREYLAASLSQSQALEYVNSVTRLKPFNVSVDAATATVAAALSVLGDLNKIGEAVEFYRSRHRPTTGKPMAEAVKDFVAQRKGNDASDRYVEDLEFRLGCFAKDCTKTTDKVSHVDVQLWLDGLDLSPQSKLNYKRVLRTFFEYCRTSGLSLDNPVDGTGKIKVKRDKVSIYTPDEAKKLLAAATPDFLPALAISLFAGLRSAEVERLEWTDLDLASRKINLDTDKTKTANGRTVDIADNLAAWIAPYVSRKGKVWNDTTDNFYRRQQQLAEAAKVDWKHNACRHSYVTYRLIELKGDLGRVAGECGNSPAMIGKHYKTLIKADAENKAKAYFGIIPDPAVHGLDHEI